MCCHPKPVAIASATAIASVLASGAASAIATATATATDVTLRENHRVSMHPKIKTFSSQQHAVSEASMLARAKRCVPRMVCALEVVRGVW